MSYREIEVGSVHHVYNKSIAGFRIFEFEQCQKHMLRLIKYYKIKNVPSRFSHFQKSKEILNEYGDIDNAICAYSSNAEFSLNIIAYCIMPTHFHFLLEQTEENGIESFMGNVLNAYTRYYNSKIKRKGPLWQSKYKNINVENDDILLHLTRYIHLNPTTAYLCHNPEDWAASSYTEYIAHTLTYNNICKFDHLIDSNAKSYNNFVKNQIDYQRSLALIKKYIFE